MSGTLSTLVLAVATGVFVAQPQPGEKKPEAPKAAAPAQAVAPKPGGDKKKEETPAPAALKVGDKAPALKIDAWVKGEEVKGFETGKVYIVEFWATWCPPCVATIPHLTKAQKDHPTLTVIGVAAIERAVKRGPDGKPVTDARLDGVKDFVKKQGAAMEYRVAFAGTGEMGKAWMQAAKQNTIPCAFIVGHDGTLAYIGDPAKMDGALSKALKAATDAKKPAGE